MAKAQKRGNKEVKKPKSAEKDAKASGPKYLRGTVLGEAGKNAASSLIKKK